MPRFQFQLRTLLLTTLLIGCALGWLFRPYTIETHWPNGELKSQSAVRRNLQGDVVTNGTQSWWWRNGQLARQGESFGVRFPPQTRWASLAIPLQGERLYNEQGEPLSPNSTDFGLMWISFHQRARTEDLWPLSPADRFAETPHE